MTKQFDLAIDKYQAASFLDAVRSKSDVIVLWMEAIKAFLTGEHAVGAQFQATLSLVVLSMSRLFCEISGGTKIFSIAFPFTVRSENSVLSFYSREGINIDNRVSSQVLSLIKGNLIFEAADFSAFIDPIVDASDVDGDIWRLVRELMLAEDGYIRYDHDAERANGHIHPLYHLDFHYSSSGSFKVGLEYAIDRKMLVSILDIGADCHYLNSAR